MNSIFRLLIGLFSLPLPWFLKRVFLRVFLGYQLDPSARIGWSLVLPENLVMGAEARIAGFTVIKSLQKVSMGAGATIGRGNWITGYAKGGPSFRHQADREPELILHAAAAITHRHILDCTGGIEIGEYAIMAGYRSQILTHSIDLQASRQHSARVIIGKYCFLGTNCVLLPGAILPDYSVLGAMSLLNKPHQESHCLYGGVPAQKIKTLPNDFSYFTRTDGYVE